MCIISIIFLLISILFFLGLVLICVFSDLFTDGSVFGCSFLMIAFLFCFVLHLLSGSPCENPLCKVEGHYSDYMTHTDDCQCNECVINRCYAINHGDTCQCDKCIKCDSVLGGN